jgi:aminoglycoside phosphotransferase (APT) family kinase protein
MHPASPERAKSRPLPIRRHPGNIEGEMSDNSFPSKLQAAVARHVGKPVTLHNLQQLTGGANRTTWSFDADVGERRERLILQLSAQVPSDEPNPLAEITPHPTAEESAWLMMAATKVGVPAPRVRAILDDSDGLGPGYITDRVDGETLAPKILREAAFAPARSKMTRQAGEILARIHSIPLAETPYLHRQTAAEMIEGQRKVIDYYDFHLPALEWGLKWAADNIPRDARLTVVHGDFRIGNMIVGENDGIRLVLDWEIGQISDPMQDLGWLCVKTWRFGGKLPVGGFGRREELFEAYEKAGGQPVDPAHVRFWEAFGSVKWATGCLRLGMRGIEEVGVERCAIGRRIEEPLWDFYELLEGRD